MCIFEAVETTKPNTMKLHHKITATPQSFDVYNQSIEEGSEIYEQSVLVDWCAQVSGTDTGIMFSLKVVQIHLTTTTNKINGPIDPAAREESETEVLTIQESKDWTVFVEYSPVNDKCIVVDTVEIDLIKDCVTVTFI